VASDNTGNTVFAGSSAGMFQSASTAFQAASNGKTNAIVGRLDPQGNLISATYFGGSANDAATAVALDNAGNVYITGVATSKDFPVTPGAFQSTFSANCPYPTSFISTGIVSIPVVSNQNAFVTKFNSTASSVLYSTYIGGNCHDAAGAIAVDNNGDAWITGSTDSSTFPQIWPVDAPPVPQGYTGFAVRIADSGAWLWRSSFFSIQGTRALAVDGAGNGYFGGGATALIQIPAHPQ
jgi:hypothetical protein